MVAAVVGEIMDELQVAIQLEQVKIHSAGMLSAINCLADGEEMEDLIRRQFAITAQVCAILGADVVGGFSHAMDVAFKLAHDNKINGLAE